MNAAEKDAISHRGRALRALVPHLAARLAGILQFRAARVTRDVDRLAARPRLAP